MAGEAAAAARAIDKDWPNCVEFLSLERSGLRVAALPMRERLLSSRALDRKGAGPFIEFCFLHQWPSKGRRYH